PAASKSCSSSSLNKRTSSNSRSRQRMSDTSARPITSLRSPYLPAQTPRNRLIRVPDDGSLALDIGSALRELSRSLQDSPINPAAGHPAQKACDFGPNTA